MDHATPPSGHDPYFQGTDIAPAKGDVPGTPAADRRRRQFRIRSIMLVVAIVAVWMWVLLDPIIRGIVFGVLLWVASTLALVGTAMGLGLLGFGVCTTGERIIGWLRRGSSWPED
jgi:hypothetical protein